MEANIRLVKFILQDEYVRVENYVYEQVWILKSYTLALARDKCIEVHNIRMNIFVYNCRCRRYFFSRRKQHTEQSYICKNKIHEPCQLYIRAHILLYMYTNVKANLIISNFYPIILKREFTSDLFNIRTVVKNVP